MKKFFSYMAFTVLAIATCVGFASCGDDDKDEPQKEIVGSWMGVDGDKIVTFTFAENGTMTATGIDTEDPEYSWAFNGTYVVSGTMISMVGYFSDEDELYDDDQGLHPFTIKDNTLMLSFDGTTYMLTRK